jgi:hypothetical protein
MKTKLLIKNIMFSSLKVLSISIILLCEIPSFSQSASWSSGNASYNIVGGNIMYGGGASLSVQSATTAGYGGSIVFTAGAGYNTGNISFNINQGNSSTGNYLFSMPGSCLVKFGSYAKIDGGGSFTTTGNISSGNFTTSGTITTTKIINNGTVSIGTATVRLGCALTVNGKIAANEFEIVDDVNVPDYVFGKNYQLRPLSDLENYIRANNHLPEVPSAKEIESNGYKVAEMDNLLLKKIEELTLYTLELNKQLNATKAELEKVKGKKQ